VRPSKACCKAGVPDLVAIASAADTLAITNVDLKIQKIRHIGIAEIRKQSVLTKKSNQKTIGISGFYSSNERS